MRQGRRRARRGHHSGRLWSGALLIWAILCFVACRPQGVQSGLPLLPPDPPEGQGTLQRTATATAILPTATAKSTPIPLAPSATPSRTATSQPTRTPTPKPHTLAVEREIYERYRPSLAALATGHPGLAITPYTPVVAGAGTPRPDSAFQRLDWVVRWDSRSEGRAVLLREEPYALIMHPLSTQTVSSLEQIRELAASGTALKLVAADDGAAANDLLGLSALPANVLPARDWHAAKEYVATHENTWALVPWEAVDFRVRTLAIGDRRLDPRALQGYPLMRRLRLISAGDAPNGTEQVPPELAAGLLQALRYQPPATIELAAVGDIMLDRLLKEQMQANGLHFPFEGEGIRPILSEADIAFGNLECALSDRGVPQPKPYQFRADPQAIEALTYSGLDVLSLANNHTGDYGEPALLDTLQRLARAGLASVGAGRTITEAHQARIIQVNGLRVAFLAYSEIPPFSFAATETAPGCAFMDRQRMVADVRAARQQADLVVVSCHWGLEDTAALTTQQQVLARDLAGAGADLVIGHHPHVVQGLRYDAHTLTAYSLGNFVFDMGPPQERWEGVILRCLLDASGVKTVEFLPTLIVACRPVLLSPEYGERITARIRRVTQEYGGLPR